MEMSSIKFGTWQTTLCFPVHLQECQDIAGVLFCESRPVITLVGSISTELPEYRQACQALLEQCVFPLAERCGAVLLSRGFSLDDPPEDDLPWLIDRVAASFSPAVTLVGVALDVNAALPEKVKAEPWRDRALCEHHTAYVLVPSLNERDACAWRTELASAITAPTLPGGIAQPGVTLVFGGAAMTWFDVLGSTARGRHAIALTHDGVIGVSTAIQELLAGCPPPRTLMTDLNKRLEEEAANMISSGLLCAVSSNSPLPLHNLLSTLLIA